MERTKILLVNPPIFDFTAYDFWLRPYGMLRTAGRIRHACRIDGFDFLVSEARDSWGRGRFHERIVEKPGHYRDISRRFRRFGRPRAEFQAYLKQHRFDVAFIQTGMTYWYPGVQQTIAEIRSLVPDIPIWLGGIYVQLCPQHARERSGADRVITVPAAKLPDLVESTTGAPLGNRPQWESLGAQPFPALDLVPNLRYVPLLTSLGCGVGHLAHIT